MYNTILRKFPKDLYDKFSSADNLFSTTIFVLASAVLKVARTILISACCKGQCMEWVERSFPWLAAVLRTCGNLRVLHNCHWKYVTVQVSLH